jgi:protocatechuate 3,4-dioxygenase beta subunit
MSEKPDEKPSVTLPGTVEKVIKPLVPNEPEKAQITVHDAEDLYKEIRVENTLTDEHGKPVKLKPGAHVEVTIEADPKDTTPAAHETSHHKK